MSNRANLHLAVIEGIKDESLARALKFKFRHRIILTHLVNRKEGQIDLHHRRAFLRTQRPLDQYKDRNGAQGATNLVVSIEIHRTIVYDDPSPLPYNRSIQIQPTFLGRKRQTIKGKEVNHRKRSRFDSPKSNPLSSIALLNYFGNLVLRFERSVPISRRVVFRIEKEEDDVGLVERLLELGRNGILVDLYRRPLEPSLQTSLMIIKNGKFFFLEKKIKRKIEKDFNGKLRQREKGATTKVFAPD